MFEAAKSIISFRKADDSVRATLHVRVARFVTLFSLILLSNCKQEAEVASQRSAEGALCAKNGQCEAQRPVWYLQNPGQVRHALVSKQGLVAQEDASAATPSRPATSKVIDLGTGSLIFAPLTDGLASVDLGDLKNLPGRFLRNVSDSDRLLVNRLNSSVGSTEQNQVVLSSRPLSLGAGELVIVRHAIAAEIDSATREACKGTVFSTGIQTTENGVTTGRSVPGAAINFGAKLMRATGAAATAFEVQDGGQYTVEVVATSSKAGCKLKLLEPATLTIFIFSPFKYIELFEKSAKFLLGVDSGDDSADQTPDDEPLRINTVESGPPVRTLKRKDFEISSGDAVVVAGSIAVSADNRTVETSAWLQVTRSPSGLSSNLSAMTLPTDGSDQHMEIIDWADSSRGSGKMRFYLNFMGTSANAKPVTVKSRRLSIYHFGAATSNPATSSYLAVDRPIAKSELLTGRWVDLFLIRSQMSSTRAVPPPEDALACPLFNSARGTGVGQVEGIVKDGFFSVPTPLHYHYQTRWGSSSINFSMIAYENIYGEAPVWTIEPPKDRESHYASRFYEVNVYNPGQTTCRATAIRQ